MIRFWTRAIAAVFTASILVGCATSGGMAIGSHVANEMSVDRSNLFSHVQGKLPPLADGDVRLFVYRREYFGGYPRPVPVVDGTFIGLVDERGVVRRSMLPHRAIFVLDTPSRPLELWLFTIEETRSQDMGRRILLPPLNGRTFFVRLALGSTYTYIEQVDEAEAMKEIQKLNFTGHLRLAGRRP